MASSYAISALTAMGTFNTGDLLVAVDITDFTQAPTGTTKKSTIAQFTTFIHASPAFTGTATAAFFVASQLTLTDNASRIIPGTTSVSFRNHANTADNLLILDNGNGTFRGAVSVLGDPLKYMSGGATTLTIGNDVTSGVVTIRTEGANRVSVSTATTAISNAVTMASTLSVTGQATLNAAQFVGAANSVVIGSQTLGSSLTPGTNDTFDLGAGSFQWRDLWLARNASILGTLAVGGATTLGDVVQITAASATPTTGSGIELTGGATPRILGFNRTGAAYLPLNIEALTINLRPSATTVLAIATGGVTTTGTHTVSGLSTLNKIKGSGSTPTATSTSGTVTVVGTDVAGIVTITSNATQQNLSATVTFAAAYATTPYVVISPTGTVFPFGPYNQFGAVTTNTFVVGGAASTNVWQSGASYQFAYHAIA